MTGNKPLENSNHEAFARALASGQNITAAYETAFPGCARTSAQAGGSRLANTPKIAARVLYLQTLHDKAQGAAPALDLQAAIRIYETLSQAATLKPTERLQALNSLVRLRRWDADEKQEAPPDPAGICEFLFSAAEGQAQLPEIIRRVLAAYKPSREQFLAILNEIMPNEPQATPA